MTRISSVMSKDVLTAVGDTPLRDIVSLMIKKRLGSVVIVDGAGRACGLVTERHLIREIVTEEPLQSIVPAKDFMTKQIVEADPDTSIEEGAKVMIRKKAMLVVTRKTKLVGVVTASDLVRAFSRGRKDALLERRITHTVQTLGARHSAKEAIDLFYQKRIGSVLVTKDGKPYGIFTERDILTKILAKGRRFDVKLGDVTSKPMVKIDEATSIKKVATLMTSKKIKRLPLIKGNKILGIITSRDLVQAFSEAS